LAVICEYLLLNKDLRASGNANKAGVTIRVATAAKLNPQTKAHAKGSVKYVSALL
jgi:hypothetical protein